MATSTYPILSRARIGALANAPAAPALSVRPPPHPASAALLWLQPLRRAWWRWQRRASSRRGVAPVVWC